MHSHSWFCGPETFSCGSCPFYLGDWPGSCAHTPLGEEGNSAGGSNGGTREAGVVDKAMHTRAEGANGSEQQVEHGHVVVARPL